MSFKTLPIPYEVYYQIKFKKTSFKSKRTAKKDLKTDESLRVKLQTL